MNDTTTDPALSAAGEAGANPAMNMPGAINPYHSAHPERRAWSFAKADMVFAAFAFALGMLFWDWIMTPGWYSPGISTTLFFVVAAVVTGVYLHSLGFRQNRRSLPALVVLLAGALPFTLYESIDIYFLLLLFELAMSLVWIMNTCRRSVTERLSGYLLADAAAQIFVVPFANFPGAFKAIAHSAKREGRSRRGLYAFVGVLVSIPVIVGVTSLLISADKGFADVMGSFFEAVNLETIGRYLLELLVGVPVACYLFGSAYGNARGRYTDSVTKTGTDESLAHARKIPLAAIRPCLIILTALYALFFIAMGTYLFSAFAGDLPSAYTYAEYARRGFFELCGVSAINLFLIVFVYLFAKRAAGEYPKSLRALTAAISSMTILLILTAASKMLLYVGMYGLTRSRVYTLWFMLLMLCVFAVVVVWHLRPFNAGKPIALAFAALVLCLFFANTDGLIAKYNVEQYQAGVLKSVDTQTLVYLSDAVVPYLQDLAETAPDRAVRSGAVAALRERESLATDMREYSERNWRNWNVQSATVPRL
ncbi:MAG: DUF4173 domain-containing protein [Clostridiales Family XIII bacterium]|jgi:hypothetical protein|nr:DUF4173 domain-containing protein [Clostridiales Family XIII bacterium]